MAVEERPRSPRDVRSIRRELSSGNLLSKLVQVHEKHEWGLRHILRQRDGPAESGR